jgi:hypothetical protein
MFSKCSSIVLLFGTSYITAQMVLPGEDNTQPGDLEAWADFVNCVQNTNAILEIPAVSDAFSTFQTAINSDPELTTCQPTSNGGELCATDFSLIPNEYKSICEANDGVYREHDVSLACFDPFGTSSSGTLTYQLYNSPMCFSPLCTESDMDRLLDHTVDESEFSIESDSTWICDSNTNAEGTTTVSKGGTCISTMKNTVEACAPLASKIQGVDCDCYTFCDGALLGCDPFGSVTTDIFCTGDLVMGCTAELFVSAGAAWKAPMAVSVITVISAIMWSMIM